MIARLAVLECFGCTIFNMKRAAIKWPRVDGGRWAVRSPKGDDTYTKTFVGAVFLAWRSA